MYIKLVDAFFAAENDEEWFQEPSTSIMYRDEVGERKVHLS